MLLFRQRGRGRDDAAKREASERQSATSAASVKEKRRIRLPFSIVDSSRPQLTPKARDGTPYFKNLTELL